MDKCRLQCIPGFCGIGAWALVRESCGAAGRLKGGWCILELYGQ